MLKKFLQDDSGATAVEYGLIAALISVALISGAKLIGVNLDAIFSHVGSEVDSAGSDFIG